MHELRQCGIYGMQRRVSKIPIIWQHEGPWIYIYTYIFICIYESMGSASVVSAECSAVYPKSLLHGSTRGIGKKKYS